MLRVRLADQRRDAWLLAARTALGLTETVLVQVTLFGAEDVILSGAGANTRKIRNHALGIGHVQIGGVSDDLDHALKSLFDHLWLASGVESGSPCRSGDTS